MVVLPRSPCRPSLPTLAPSLDSSLPRMLIGLPAVASARRYGECPSCYCPALLQGTSLNPYSFSIYSLTSKFRSFCQMNIYSAPFFLSSYTRHLKGARPEMQQTLQVPTPKAAAAWLPSLGATSSVPPAPPIPSASCRGARLSSPLSVHYPALAHPPASYGSSATVLGCFSANL